MSSKPEKHPLIGVLTEQSEKIFELQKDNLVLKEKIIIMETQLQRIDDRLLNLRVNGTTG